MTDRGTPAPPVARARAEALLAARRPQEAVKELSRALALAPDDAALHCLMAQALLAAGDVRGAIAAAKRAVSCEPGGEWGHRLLALSLKATGAMDRALAEANEAVRLAPESRNTVHTLGTCQLDGGQLKQASATARRLVSLAPEWSMSHQLSCRVALRHGDSYEAMQHARSALALDPLSATDWNNLGVALQAQGEHLEAAKVYVRTLQLDPTLTAARMNLKRLVMPLTVIRRERTLRTVLLVPFWMPRVLYFQIILRRKLPDSIRNDFLATPVRPLEGALMAVAVVGSCGILVVSAVTGAVTSFLYSFVLVGATVIYSLVRLADTVRWWLCHRQPRS